MENPWSAAKAELGRSLFFDARLSGRGRVSCASCHVPEAAFASREAIPRMGGVREGMRNAPSLVNTAYEKALGWDGRWDSIESAITGHFQERGLMGADLEAAVAQLKAVTGYATLSQAAFGQAGLEGDRIPMAIAVFVRTLLSGNAPYDRFMAGQPDAVTARAAAGKELFFGRGGCAGCHKGPTFTSGEFVSVGAGSQNPPDEGRSAVTRIERDYRTFRVPGLREVARTAPYFHDGSAASIEEVMAFFDRGGEMAENRDPRMTPLKLTEADRAALVEFLKSLSGEGWQHGLKPPEPPK
jgi:cytochrome c peroxidase